MIWALLAVLLFGGALGGSVDGVVELLEEKRERLEEVVPEDARRQRAQAVVDGMIAHRERLLEDVAKLGDDLANALGNRGTPREVFQSLLDEIEERRVAAWAQQVDARFALREQLSADEWRELFAKAPQ